MKADQFIVGRVSSETKARLRALAEKELLSESALLRRLVELVLLKAGLRACRRYSRSHPPVLGRGEALD
jgi:hypothetical protein